MKALPPISDILCNESRGDHKRYKGNYMVKYEYTQNQSLQCQMQPTIPQWGCCPLPHSKDIKESFTYSRQGRAYI